MLTSRALCARALPALVLLFWSCGAAAAVPRANFVRVPLSVPAAAASARPLGLVSADQPIRLALTLPLRHQNALSELLRRLYTPGDPLCGQYLTPDQFADQFGPDPADYDTVIAWARAQGLSVTGIYSNRALLDLSGPAQRVEAAFGVTLRRYQSRSGRIFRAPTGGPVLPAEIADRLSGIIGLDTAAVRRSHLVRRDDVPALALPQSGSGPEGGLSPDDIRTAYALNTVSLDGTGQTLALFELDGYTSSDVAGYEANYGLPNVPLQNILLDSASGAAGTDADEVTLDIELQLALAHGASRVLVYETSNTDRGTLDGYTRIATDDRAKQISTSWGLDEPDTSASLRSGENAIFQQMAAQGQSIFSASGDFGAYDTGSMSDGLTVDDPASQPYVTGIGGTSLTTHGPGGTWAAETTWNSGSVSAGASGGGISAVWPIPSWQQGAVSPGSGGSTTMRNVPDVALDSDPNTGYSIYYNGGWHVYGGTSAAAPVWAGYAALINQQRALNGQSPLGFANPAIYAIGKGLNYARDFHDIADNSSNLFYHAVAAYDLTTGWGSPIGIALLSDLAPTQPPAAPTNLTATPGDSRALLRWTAGANTSGYILYRSTVSGSGYVPIATSTDTTYTDTGLTNGTTYYYVVAATNIGGQSGFSSQASATPAPVTSSPYPAGLNLIALPYDYPGVPLDSLFGYANVRLAVWQTSNLLYAVTPAPPANEIRLGRGYWVRFPAPEKPLLFGAPADTIADFPIALTFGWNQIGDPFLTNIPLSALKIQNGGQTDTFADASGAAHWIGANVYRYNNSSGQYVLLQPADPIQPGLGYWIHAWTPVTLLIPHP